MPLLRDIVTYMRQIAPESSAMSGDPVGLSIQYGIDGEVSKVGVCLDITPAGALEAAELGVELVVCHHPLIYRPMAIIDTTTDRVSQTVVTLVTSRISLYAAHTNWDRAEGGINDTLAKLLGLEEILPLKPEGDAALARIGRLSDPMSLKSFRSWVSQALDCNGENELRFGGDNPEKTINRVAICGGAGAGLFMHDALEASADVYLTSDVRHHEWLDAAAIGLPLLDGGHGATERPGMHALLERLSEQFPDLETIWLT